MADTPSRRVWSFLFAVAVVAVAFAAILVTLNQQRRQLTLRLNCALQMKSVGTAVQIYASEQDPSPEALIQRLVRDGELAADQHLCPVSGKPYQFASSTWSAGATDFDPGAIIVYEPLSNHHNQGANVLYADGHCKFERPAAFRELLTTMQPPESPRAVP